MATQSYLIPEKEIRRQADADGITHLTTGIAVVYKGKILAVRRAKNDYLGGSYELPGGGVDDGETLADSIARELFEETGLRLSRILGMFPGFEYSTPVKPRVRQFNFLVETSNHKIRLSAEHDDFALFNSATADSLNTTGPMKQCFKQALAMAKQL